MDAGQWMKVDVVCVSKRKSLHSLRCGGISTNIGKRVVPQIHTTKSLNCASDNYFIVAIDG